jgi:cytochrome c-type biogenesis protein CcmH
VRLRFALALALTLVALAMPAALGTGSALAAAPRTSLNAVEDDIMCPSCHEPLALAQSPQAIAERNFIRTLVAKGETKAQIERDLVAQYGNAVLAKPPAHGFNLTVYVLPPLLLLAGLVMLGLTLPRWRRRARAAADAPLAAAGPQLSDADARRLDEDLARYD